MEWFVYILLGSATLYVCVFIARVRKHRDETALEDEITSDFLDEFESDESGELTDKGMEDMLDWLENQDEAQRMEGIEELDKSGDHSRVVDS
ncbi:MAG: hypothetical protein VCA36_02780 [Opitutales bacterium]